MGEAAEDYKEYPFHDKELVYFREGLFGFEDQKKFLPICIEEHSDAVLCLQSVEDENLSFIIMNPFLLMEDYHPVLSKNDYKKLEAEKEQDLSYYVICVVREKAEESTVNMRCPIVVNTVNRQARQVVLDSDAYQFRHVLKELGKGETGHADSAS